nr:unnamed protein product [Spirometra erinaceieuropaei]
MSPEVSCGGELEKGIAPKGTIQAAHDTESLYHVSAQLPITQRIEIKEDRLSISIRTRLLRLVFGITSEEP